MRVLITGGFGFVGRHLLARCQQLGYDTVVVDNLSTGKLPKAPFQGLYEIADVRDWFQHAECDFDLVFHCAAVVGGRLKIDGDPIAVATDLAIDADFFNWLVASTHRPKRVVYFSSSAVYPVEMQTGNYGKFLLNESLVRLDVGRIGMPDQTYGWAKLTGEVLAHHAVKTYGLPIAIYRPFSGYGSDQEESYPFPAIMRRVINRENPLTVWGSGKQVRDFIHIDDIVDAVFETMFGIEPGATLNLGTERGASMRRLAEVAAGIAGYSPEIRNDPSKPEGVACRVADCYNLHQVFRPRITVEEGIKRALTEMLA